MADSWKTGGRIVAMLSCGIAASLALTAAGTQYAYDQPGDKRFVNNTAVLERASAAGNNQSEKVVAQRARVDAAFTRQSVTVDGVREAAWDAATSYPIANPFNADMTAAAPDAPARGTLR